MNRLLRSILGQNSQWFCESVFFISWGKHWKGVYLHLWPRYTIRFFLWGVDAHRKFPFRGIAGCKGQAMPPLLAVALAFALPALAWADDDTEAQAALALARARQQAPAPPQAPAVREEPKPTIVQHQHQQPQPVYYYPPPQAYYQPPMYGAPMFGGGGAFCGPGG